MLAPLVALVSALVATPALAAPPPPTDELESERSLNRRVTAFTAGMGMVAGGVIGLGLGFGLGVREFREWNRQLDDLLAAIKVLGGRPPVADLRLAILHDRLDTARNHMIVWGVVGTALIGTGAGLIHWSRKRGPLVTRSRVVPFGSPQVVGLSFAGRF